MAIFSIFGYVLILYSQRKCRQKNKKNFDNFSIKNLGSTFVSFFIGQSLVEEFPNNSILTNNIRPQRISIATQNSIVSFVTAPLNCYFALRSEDSIVDLLACKGNKLR